MHLRQPTKLFQILLVNSFFLLTFVSAQDSECGSLDLTALPTVTQTISSPNFPSPYEPSVNCWWIIKAPSHHKLLINIVSFKTEFCCDKLKVYDSSTTTNNANLLIRTLAGTVRPTQFSSDNSFVALNFKSDSSLNFAGFSITYTAQEEASASTLPQQDEAALTTTIATTTPPRRQDGECQRDVLAAAEAKLINPPGYPGLYRSNLECDWLIIPQNGERVQLSIGLIDTQTCCDIIEVFEGNEKLSRLSGRLLNVERFISSPNSPLRITFDSDVSVNRAGFRMVYRSVPGSATADPLSIYAVCGESLVATQRIQTLTSPNWPGRYPQGIRCVWTITRSIQFLSIDVTLERLRTPRCCDFLEIQDGGTRLALLSGNAFSRRFTINDEARIILLTNSSNPGTGFRINFRQAARRIVTTTQRTTTSTVGPSIATTTVRPITSCSESQLNAHIGRSTPMIISREIGLSVSSNCWWTITAPTSYHVRITFTSFTLDPCCDSIIVYNSRSQSHSQSSIIKEFNGNEPSPQVVFSDQSFLTLFFHIDTLNTVKGFEASFDAVEHACGFEFVIPDGRVYDLNSPNYPENYPSSIVCEWKISTLPGNVVQFTIGELQSEPCCDYLEIFEGNRQVDKLRGKVDEIQFTSVDHRGFRIRFLSDKSVERKGFRGVFSSSPVDDVKELTVPSDCGYEITASRSPQNLTSPGWHDGVYSMNLDCYWTIVAPTIGFQVFFSIVDGRTETCCDYVEILSEGRVLDKLSGPFTDPTLFVSTNQSLRIYFHSDRSQAYQGFRAVFYEGPPPTTPVATTSPVAESTDCGFTATVNGIIQQFSSPNYPEPYSANAFCEWNFISFDPNFLVKLTFSQFHTEPCCDTVQILEGTEEVETLRGTLSSVVYISKGNNVTVRFRSDSSDQRRGFNATFVSISEDEIETTTAAVQPTLAAGQSCGYEIVALETPHDFISPGWPLLYPSSASCNWTITSAPGWKMYINFTSFETERCCDILTISDDTGLLGSFGGDLTSQLPYLMTSQTELFLRFVSDKNIRKSGFTAIFGAIPPPTTTPAPTTPAYVCEENVNVTSSVDVITSQGFPYYYASMTNCTWTLVAPEGERILVNFTTVSLETCCDYIQVYDGDTEEVLDKFSHESLPANQLYVSSGHVMKFRFISDVNIAGEGFMAQVGTLQDLPAYTCDSTVFVSPVAMQLASPNYPQNYSVSTTCDWTLVTSQGRRVVVNFTDFQTESCCDYVELRDATNERLIAKVDMHAVRYSTVFESTSSTMRLSFHSDKSVTDRGFLATLYSTPDDYVVNPGACGFNSVAGNSSTYFHSPNYPVEYPARAECHWLIVSTNQSEQVELNLHDFSFEGDSDYLEIRNGRTQTSPLIGYVRRDHSQQAVFSSTTGALYVKMRTDTTHQYRGFNASYKLVPTERSCGSTLLASDMLSQIRTSNDSGIYPNLQNCTWTLTADEGKVVVLNFTFMKLETCCDRVLILDGSEERLIDNTTHYGLISPLTYRSSTNILKVRFISDDSIGDQGFIAQFSQEKAPDDLNRGSCGFTRTATPHSFEFSSPGYPVEYPSNAECHWLIVSRDEDKQVQLEILDFRTEKCCDFLKVYDGTSAFSPLRASLSDVIQSPDDVITSSSGSLYVTFSSDGSGTAGGFLATFKLVEIETTYSSRCYSVMKAFSDARPIVKVKERMECPPKHQCLTVKTIADAQEKKTGDLFEASVTYGTCVPSIACPVTSCDSLMTLLEDANLPFRANFTTCVVDCCNEDLCNDDGPPLHNVTTTPVPTTSVHATTDENGCWRREQDIMFLLDGSGSFTALEFMEMLKFVNHLVAGFDLETTRVGVMQFSHWYRHRPMNTRSQTFLKTHIRIGQYRNLGRLQNAITSINHHGYTTYTAHAIEKAITIDYPHAGKFSDPCTTKLIVVITDGKATDAFVLPTTTSLARALGFTFFAVGISEHGTSELQIIANGQVGSDERVFVVPWADQLNTISDQLFTQLNNVV